MLKVRVITRLATVGAAAAHFRIGRNKDAALPVLGIDDLDVHHARAQLQELQIIPARSTRVTTILGPFLRIVLKQRSAAKRAAEALQQPCISYGCHPQGQTVAKQP